MQRTLVASFPTSAGRVAGFRSMADALLAIAEEHSLSLGAAAEAELPRKWQSDLRTLYTGKKNKSAR
jgi:hypothetical protein